MKDAVIKISSAHAAPHSHFTRMQGSSCYLHAHVRTLTSVLLCLLWHILTSVSRHDLRTVQSSDSKAWDEVMVVAYKSRWQFFQMALLTPSYWPLS